MGLVVIEIDQVKGDWTLSLPAGLPIEALQTRRKQRAPNHVKDHVDTLATGLLPDLFGQRNRPSTQISEAVNVIQKPKANSIGVTARRPEHCRSANTFCNASCCISHSSGGAGDENGFALLEGSNINERVPRSEIRNPDDRGLLESQRARLRLNRFGRHFEILCRT